MPAFTNVRSRNAIAAGTPLWRTCIATSVAVVFVIGLLLFVRRVGGAFDSPLSPPLLLVSAALLVAWHAIVRDTIPVRPNNSARRRFTSDVLIHAAAWSSLALFAVASSHPFTRIIDWLIWPTAFAAAWFGPQALQTLRDQSTLFRWLHRTSYATATPADDDDALPIQVLTRYRTHDGVETIHGQLRAEFPPGERDTTVYIAFCPPFTRLPAVEAYLTDDITAEVKLTQVLHHGAQIEIRLSVPARVHTAVNVELVAAESAGTPANR